VFGTREKHEREIDAREREERVTTSPVWNSKETTKRDQILVGPALFMVLSYLRRNESNEA
jgi:hypothetical protein